MKNCDYNNIKKENELNVAKYFLDFINIILKFDYCPFKNTNEIGENSHIDIYGISKSSKYENLILQIIYNDGEYFGLSAQRAKEIKKNKIGEASSSVRSIQTAEWIKTAVKAKFEKYTKHSKKIDNIILLIQGMPWERDINTDYLKNQVKDILGYDFRGIYFIIPPYNNQIVGEHFLGEIKILKQYSPKSIN